MHSQDDQTDGDVAGVEEDDEALEVSTVEPFHGTAAGGMTVTIRGIGFDAHDKAEVTALIGGYPCTATAVLDLETITCIAPPVRFFTFKT